MEIKYKSGAINYNPSYGQVWTEKETAKHLVEKTNDISPIMGNVLEPAVGNRVFIHELSKYSIDNLDGFEVDPKVFGDYSSGGNIINDDFLFRNIRRKYDFIFGMVPFVHLRFSFYSNEEKSLLKSKNPEFGENIRLMDLFVKKSHKILNTGGYLSCILHSVIDSGGPLKNFIEDNFNELITEEVPNRPFMKMFILEKLP